MADGIERWGGRHPPLASLWAETWTVLIALVLLLVLRRLVAREARRRASTPAVFLLVALLLRMAVPAVPGSTASVLGLLAVLCLVVGLVGIVVLVVFDVALRRRAIPSVVRDMTQIVAVAIVFVGILFERGFDPVSLAATGGVLTAVVGFALQSTIANVFAGVALPIEHQIGIGDWIEVGGVVGRVHEIKWRATAVVTKDGDTVIVPNNQLITTSVTNYSRPTPAHRAALEVHFSYRHPPNEVRAMLLDAVRGPSGVLQQPPADCFPVRFGESGVTYLLRVWVDDFLTLDPVLGDVRARVWYAARRAGLEIPYPVRTIVAAAAPAEAADDRLAALDRIDLFAPIEGASRARLAGEMREQRFGAGEDVIRQDDPGDSLFIVARGAVDVRVAVDGVRRSIARLGPGQFFGEMSLMTGEPRQATCRAATDTVCWVVDQALFRSVLDAQPSIAEDISGILAERQVELDASKEDLSAEAHARRTHETRSRLLGAIRRAFAA
jgi:small-conductance mechanosensitive channel/CRP-like cAMP-binding protein